MPLSKAKNRERMRALRRATYVQPKPQEAVQPKVPVNIPGLVMQGNRIVSTVKPSVQPVCNLPDDIPFDNPGIKPGQLVKKWNGVRYVAIKKPELDGDGNVVW